jgi:glyoxylase-like metal-dependent hydrolase (beta-lactamase superfamily II)
MTSSYGHVLASLTLMLMAVLPSPSEPTNPSAQQPTIQVHTHTSGMRGYDANAYWIESRDGLVLIDALMLRSDARGLVAAMKTVGKPLAGILITHPHLDHLAGISTVRAAFGDVPVYATQATIDGIAPTWKRALADGWPQAHGDDFDLVPPVPDKVVASGDTVSLAGMTFRMQDYGPMEAENNSVIHQVELNVLFTGDMTVPNAPFYVGEGRSAASIAALTRLATDFPSVRVAFSGHYGSMPLAPLVARNIEDIKQYRSIVTAYMLLPDGDVRGLTADSRAAASHAIADHLRHGATYGIGARAMAQMNVAGLEAELTSELARKKFQPETTAAMRGLAPLMGLVGRWRGDIAGQTTDITLALTDGATTLSADMTFRTMRVRLALSYDVYQRRYRMTAVDDVTGLIDVFTGHLNEAGALVLTNVDAGTFYLVGGEPVHTKISIQMRVGGGWSLQTAESPNRGTTWEPRLEFVTTQRLPS